MPIYEYHCQDCRRRVSVFFRTFSAASDEVARCPRCNGANLHRLVSRVAVPQIRREPDGQHGRLIFYIRIRRTRDSVRLAILDAQDERLKRASRWILN